MLNAGQPTAQAAAAFLHAHGHAHNTPTSAAAMMAAAAGVRTLLPHPVVSNSGMEVGC